MRKKTLLKLLKTQKNELDAKVLSLNNIIAELKKTQLAKNALEEEIKNEEIILDLLRKYEFC